MKTLNVCLFKFDPQTLKGRTLILLANILISWLLPETVVSQPCDPHLEPHDSRAIAYRPRGNRCEGFYTSDVSEGSLDIVGVVMGAFRYQLDPKEILSLSAPLIDGRTVHVRAVAIPLKTYYRMDAQIDAGQTLTWPIGDILYKERLAYKKIGVSGRLQGESKEVLVPVKAVSTLNPLKSDQKIRVILRASVNVEKVKWHYSKRINGICSPFEDWQDIDPNDFQAGDPIRIILPAIDAPEICFEMAARDGKTGRWLKRNAIIAVARSGSD